MSDNQNISLKDALICIPIFTGKPEELIDFSNFCEKAKCMLPEQVESNLTKLIFGSKLSPSVKDALNKITYSTVNELLRDLKKVYVPSKTLFQLQGELGRMFQKDDKLVVDFVNRLRKKAKEIVECFKSNNPTATPNEIQIYKDNTDKAVAQCFVQNLRNEIDQRMSRCDNVTEALEKAIEIERRLIARREIRKDPNNKSLDNNSQEKPKIICHSCNKPGHIKKNCREKDNNNSRGNCQLCNKTGHTAKNCFKNPNRVSSNVKCQICEKNGKTNKNKDVIMMIDSGASPNLLKFSYVNDPTTIDKSKIVELHGIANVPIKTLGRVKVKLFNKETVCHVIPDTLSIPHAGLVGSRFFATHGVKIDYKNKVMKVDNVKYPFKKANRVEDGVMCIPPRSESTFFVKVKNKNIVEGYVPRLKACKGVFLGDCLVRVNDGRAYMQVFNTTENEVGLKIPTLFIQSVENLHDPKIDQEDCLNRNCEIETQSDFNKLNFKDFNVEKILSIVENFQNDKRFKKIIKLWRLSHLGEEERKHVEKFLKKYADRFHIPDEPLGSTDVYNHKIPTTSDIPITVKQYRTPQFLKTEIEKQIKEELDTGIIGPSESPYNSPVWIVPKKPDSQGNKRWRVVIDYRKLNERTITDAYPLPNITDILDQLGGSMYFSVFDLASGYHQIKMDPKDSHKTAFSTPQGHWEFKRMPFGLKNAPATFQRLMDTVLTGLQGISMFVYLDD
ncbi:uncharacterized protein, partial [Chelonus insularis]|uniref:uncharacterized protein n=1 Tax=Chelonus insularis TaxID=460826 RepID=UPI00158F5F25